MAGRPSRRRQQQQQQQQQSAIGGSMWRVNHTHLRSEVPNSNNNNNRWHGLEGGGEMVAPPVATSSSSMSPIPPPPPPPTATTATTIHAATKDDDNRISRNKYNSRSGRDFQPKGSPIMPSTNRRSQYHNHNINHHQDYDSDESKIVSTDDDDEEEEAGGSGNDDGGGDAADATASVNTLAAFLVESENSPPPPPPMNENGGDYQQQRPQKGEGAADGGGRLKTKTAIATGRRRRSRDNMGPAALHGGADMEILRRKQIQQQALINALNHFILQAGNIYRGKQLSFEETQQLYDVADQVGLAQSVVDALVSTTSNPNAVIEYCLYDSHCAFAQRIQTDPYLRSILNIHQRQQQLQIQQQQKQNNNRQDDDDDSEDNLMEGLNLTSSIWRVFMHKIIQQFLQQKNLELADIMDSSSLTSKLYEEAFRDRNDDDRHRRNDINNIGRFDNTEDNGRFFSRNYTEERKMIMIPEPDAKMARLEAEANMDFRRRKPFQDYVDRESDQFQPHEVFRDNRNLQDDDELSILAPGAGRRSSMQTSNETFQSQHHTTMAGGDVFQDDHHERQAMHVDTHTSNQHGSPRRSMRVEPKQTPRRSVNGRERWINSPDKPERVVAEEEFQKPSKREINIGKSIVQKARQRYETGAQTNEGTAREHRSKGLLSPEVRASEMPKKSTVSMARAMFERGGNSKPEGESPRQFAPSKKIRDSLVLPFQGKHQTEEIEKEQYERPRKMNGTERVEKTVPESPQQFSSSRLTENTSSQTQKNDDRLDSVFEIGDNADPSTTMETRTTAFLNNGRIHESRQDQMQIVFRSKDLEDNRERQPAYSYNSEENYPMEYDANRFEQSYPDDFSTEVPIPPTNRDSILLYSTRMGSKHLNNEDGNTGSLHPPIDCSGTRMPPQYENEYGYYPSEDTPFQNISNTTMHFGDDQRTEKNSLEFDEDRNWSHPRKKEDPEKQAEALISKKMSSVDEISEVEANTRKAYENSVSLGNRKQNWEQFDIPFEDSYPSSQDGSDMVMANRSDESDQASQSKHYFEKLLTQEIDPPIDYDQPLSSNSSELMETKRSETQQERIETSQKKGMNFVEDEEIAPNIANSHDHWENFDSNFNDARDEKQETSRSFAQEAEQKTLQPSSVHIMSTENEQAPSEISEEEFNAPNETHSSNRYSKVVAGMAQLSLNGEAFMVRSGTTTISRIPEQDESRNILEMSNRKSTKKKKEARDEDRSKYKMGSTPFHGHSKSLGKFPTENQQHGDYEHDVPSETDVYQRKFANTFKRTSPTISASKPKQTQSHQSTIHTLGEEMKQDVGTENWQSATTESLSPNDPEQPKSSKNDVSKTQLSEIEALDEYRARRGSLHPKDEDIKERRIRETILKLAVQELDEGQPSNMNHAEYDQEYQTRRNAMLTSAQPTRYTSSEKVDLVDSDDYEDVASATMSKNGQYVDRDDYEDIVSESMHSLAIVDEAPDRATDRVLEIKNSSSTSSNMLRVDTASTCDEDDDDDDDVGLNSPSNQIQNVDHVAVFSRSPYYQSKYRSTKTEEEEIRAAAKQNGIPSPVIDIILQQTRDGSDHEVAAQALKRKAKYDSDTGLPASARHLHSSSQSTSAFPSSPRTFDAGRSPSRSAFSQYDHSAYDIDEYGRPDPSPESRRPSQGVKRSEPEGASKEGIALLNNFIEVASGDFGVQKLSTESEKKLRAAAEKVGLTPKFVDQVLKQTQNQNQQEVAPVATPATTAIAGSGRSRFDYNSISRPGLQEQSNSNYRHPEQHHHHHQQQPGQQDQYHQYPAPNQSGHSHDQYYTGPNGIQSNDYLGPSQYSPSNYPPTVDLTRTTRQTKETQTSYDGGCGNVWENLSKNILESWTKCTTGATPARTRRSSDDASSISSAQSWDYQHHQKRQKKKQPQYHHSHHYEYQNQPMNHYHHDPQPNQYHGDSGRRERTGGRNGLV